MTLTYFLKVKDSNPNHFDTWNVFLSQTVTEQIILLPTYKMSLTDFRLVYLHLTLAHCKGQSQGHANFDCDYIENGDRWDKYFFCQYIESRLLAFVWYIYIAWMNFITYIPPVKAEGQAQGCILRRSIVINPLGNDSSVGWRQLFHFSWSENLEYSSPSTHMWFLLLLAACPTWHT